jgi:hypothetical protein
MVWAARSGLSGVANAAPIVLSRLYVGRLLSLVHLIQPLIFPLLVANVLSNCCLIPACGRHKVSPRPEALPCMVLLPLSVHPRRGWSTRLF